MAIDLNLFCRKNKDFLYVVHECNDGYFTKETIDCQHFFDRFYVFSTDITGHYNYNKQDETLYHILSALTFEFKKCVENDDIWGVVGCLKKQDALLHKGKASDVISGLFSGGVYISPQMIFAIKG